MPLGVAQWLRGGGGGSGIVPERARKALWAGKRLAFGNRVSSEYGKK